LREIRLSPSATFANQNQPRDHIQRSSSMSGVPPKTTADSHVRIISSPKREDLSQPSSQEAGRQTPIIRSYSSRMIHLPTAASIHSSPPPFTSLPVVNSYYLPSYPSVQQAPNTYLQQSNYFPQVSVAPTSQTTYHGNPKSYEPIRISTFIEQRPTVAASLPRQSRDSEISVSLSTIQYSTQRITPQRTEVRSDAITIGPIETPRSTQPAFGTPNLSTHKQALIDSQKRIVLLSMENSRLAAKAQDYEQAFVEMRARINALEVQLHDYERLANEYGRMKGRSDSLEARIQEVLEERGQFLTEIELLQSTSKRSRTTGNEVDELRDQLQSLSDENDELRNRFTLVVTENSRLQSITHENEDLRNQIFSTNQERDKLAADLRDRNSQLEKSGRELQKTQGSNDEVTNLRNKLAMLVSENELLQGIRPENLRLKENVVLLGNEIDMLRTVQRENSELRAALSKKETQSNTQPLGHLNDNTQGQRNQSTVQGTEIEQPQRAMAHSASDPRSQETDSRAQLEASHSGRNELDVLRAKASELAGENEGLRQQLTDSRVEFEQVILDLDKKLQTSPQKSDELEPLKRSLGALTHERDDLNRKLVSAQNEINALEAKNQMLQTEVENERKTLSVLHQRCELYEKDSQEMRAKLQETEAPLSRSGHFERTTHSTNDPNQGYFQSQLDEVSEENRQLKAEITDLDELLLNKDHDIEEVSKYSKFLEGELSEARNQLVEKGKEIEKLIDEVKLLQQRMGSSKSPDTDNLITSK